MSRGDVAVVGMACVFPGARNLDAYWRNLTAGVDAVGDLPGDRWPGSRNFDLPPEHDAHIACRRGGFIRTPYLFDPARHRVMPNVARHGDPDQFLLLDVLADALADAGVAEDSVLRADTDLIVGRGGYTSNKMMEVFLRGDGFDRLLGFLAKRFPGLDPDTLADLDEGMRATLPPFDVDGLASSIPNLVPSRAANRLDLGGAAFTVDAACASSLIAVEQAVQRLRDERCGLAIAAGINFTHIPAFWYLFTRILAMSPTGGIRPFDRRADGMLIGEGAGAVVLKRVEDAARDGDRVYAIVRGAGSASDGRATGLLAPSSGGQVRALERAYGDARVDPADISFLEAHGTGTPIGDQVELESIRAFYGSARGAYGTRVIGSVKSMIGHTMPAAGVASLIKACLSLSNKIIPPSLHCDDPHPLLADTPFFVSGTTRPWLHDPAQPRRAGVNAFGFGGINAHVVVEEVVEEVAEASTRTSVAMPVAVGALATRPLRTGMPRHTELLPFAGADRAALAVALRRAARYVADDQGPRTLEDLAFTLGGEADAGAACRLGIVAHGDEGLAERLETLAVSVEDGSVRTREAGGVFFEENGSDTEQVGKVAAVFPGIAFPGLVGEFPGHILSNCLHFPCVREVFDQVEGRDGHPEDALPTSFLLVPPRHVSEEDRQALLSRFAPPPAAPTDATEPPPARERNLSHMGMLVNNWASWKLLGSLGVRADMLCGQSLGDVSAVLAAGMADFESNIPRFWKAFDLQLPYQGTGCIAVVGTTEEILQDHLDAVEDVTIGLHLSPTTLVVGGPEVGVKALCTSLRAEGVLAQKLPFPPVHTPQLEAVQDDFQTAMGEMDALRPANRTIYSAVLAAPMPEDPAAVEEILRTNVSRPIRFWQTVRRMHADGARFVIQIGSGTLAANSRSVLEAGDAVCVAMDVAHREPLCQVQHMAGELFAHGLPFDLEALFPAREPARLDLDAPRASPAPPRTAVPLTLYWPPMYSEAAPTTGPAAEAPPSGRATEPDAEADDGVQAGSESRLPFLGEVLAHEPGQRIAMRVAISLAEHRYLEDHAFISEDAPKPLQDRFPVLPLTMTLEMMAEVAACLAPGLGLLGFEQVRALRWIALEEKDAVDVRVEAERLEDADGEAVVYVQAHSEGQKTASAYIRFGRQYTPRLEFAFHEWTNAAPFPVSAAQLYEDRYLFHGKRFRALSAIHERGDQGIRGDLQVLGNESFYRSTPRPTWLTDPVVLDAAGQLLGSYFYGIEAYVLPLGVDRIEFYGPPPPRGRTLPTRVEFTEIDLDARRTSARIEIQDGAGGVWCRIEGWQDVVFRWSGALQRSRRHPETHLLAEECAMPELGDDAVVVLLERNTLRDLPDDWLARIHLAPSEWPAWRAFEGDGRRGKAWLMGRVAAKDAARCWLARREGKAEMRHPVGVEVQNDAEGRPYVAAAIEAARLPRLTISHTARGAAAIVATGPVGVDVEEVGAGARLVPEDFATPAELALLRGVAGEAFPEWVTRLWCAKEAAAKAQGRGLEGRPKAWEAVGIDREGRFAIRPREGEKLVEVHTLVRGGLVLAAGRPAEVTAFTDGRRSVSG